MHLTSTNTSSFITFQHGNMHTKIRRIFYMTPEYLTRRAPGGGRI